MSKNRSFVIALVVSLVFAISCASAGNKKPMVFVDSHNKIPADILSQFTSRYERFITGNERKEFKKLQTDEGRQAFTDKFWAERDTDPTTPENEYKQEIDERIDNIANEPFVSLPGVFGLSSRTNGGFRGDMAQVYLLHGEPDAMDSIEGHSFVDLMLWVYVDEQNGEILYAFLFYQQGSMGVFSLFPQDGYKLDPCGAINQISKRFKGLNVSSGNQVCPPDVEEVFRELQTAIGKGGILDGYIFAWALFNFSQDGSLSQGLALGAPKSALEIARQSKARVVGEAPALIGTAGTDYILAFCKECNSFIPAELHLNGQEFTLAIRRGNIDWQIVDGQPKSVLKIRVVIESATGQAPLVFERWATVKSLKNLIVSDPTGQRVIPLLTADEIAQIPAGTYWVSVYVKNLMTKKYNAWYKEITK